jgi:hypothetical protein
MKVLGLLFFIMTTTSKTKEQRYSQELSAYTLRQFCLARALLDRKDAEAIPLLSAAYRRVAQADKIANGQTRFELGIIVI